MELSDAASLIVRWVHAAAAALWVGGGFVYLVVLAPRKNADGIAAEVSERARRRFVRTATAAIGVFIITGGLMTAQRLAEPGVDAGYVRVLVAKIAVSLTAFALVWRRAEMLSGWEGWPLRSFLDRLRLSPAAVAIALGAVAYLLAIVLRFLVERRLAGG